MRVLFVNPARSGQGTVPLNIPILISVLRAAGHEVRLFDFSDYAMFDTGTREYESRYFREAPMPEGMCLKETDPAADFDQTIQTYRPEVIAVTALSVDFNYAIEFLRPFNRSFPGIPIIFGGIHTILLPDEVLRTGVVDYIVGGEGERALPDLLSEIERYGRDLTTRSAIQLNFKSPFPLTDLNSLPPPDYSDFNPIHFYRPFAGRRYKMLNYEFSRGCPFNCTYCVNGTLKERYRGLGPYHRVKEIRHSIDEIKYLVDRYSFDFIRFWDEDFTVIPPAIIEEYAGIYHEEVYLPFIIYARVDTMSERSIRALKEMGCVGVSMGI